MESSTTGRIVGVNGNMLTVAFENAVAQNEIGYAQVGDVGLMAEVVRIRGELADMQVYEDTTGLMIGAAVQRVCEEDRFAGRF